MPVNEHKRCFRCRKIKDRSNFGLDASRGDKLQPCCKQCRSDTAKLTYQSSDKVRKRTRKSSIERRILRQQIVWDYLLDKKCIDCGISGDPRILEFDHVRGRKIDTISSMIYKETPLKEIEEEIEKCDIRCCCCHRIKTHEEGDHNRYVIKEGVDIGWKTRELFDPKVSFKDKGLIPSPTLNSLDRDLKGLNPVKEYWVPDFISEENFTRQWYASLSLREVGRRTGVPNECCKQEGIKLGLTFGHFSNSKTVKDDSYITSKILKSDFIKVWSTDKSFRQVERDLGMKNGNGSTAKKIAKKLGLVE